MIHEIFAAIVLDESSQERLRRFANPEHKLYAHHVTLAHGLDLTDEHRALVGRKAVVLVTGMVKCDYLVAAEVILDRNLHCCNRFPHVTVSVAVGHAPVESNYVIADCYDGDRSIELDSVQIRLSGTCDLFVKDDEDSHAKWLNGSE